MTDSTAQSAQSKSNTDPHKAWCEAPCCYNATEIFSAAAGVSLLLYQNLNICQLETVVNLLTLINANLAAFITQAEINSGEQVEPPF